MNKSAKIKSRHKGFPVCVYNYSRKETPSETLGKILLHTFKLYSVYMTIVYSKICCRPLLLKAYLTLALLERRTAPSSSSIVMGGRKYCRCCNVLCKWTLQLTTEAILGSFGNAVAATVQNGSDAEWESLLTSMLWSLQYLPYTLCPPLLLP